MNGCHPFEPGTGGQLWTAERTATSSSCRPRRSIVASAEAYQLPIEALVGTYLKNLPDDGLTDLAVETTHR
jgi:hypothetical protein